MVPIAADVFERKTKRFALAWSQRRQTEINRIRIRPAGLQNVQRNIFGLRDFSQRILERDMHKRVSNSFIAAIGHSPINVSYAGADEVLGCAHFQIGELQVGCVRMWSGRASWIAASKQRNGANHDHHERHAQQNRAQVRIAFSFTQRRWLDETSHATIVLLAAGSKSRSTAL